MKSDPRLAVLKIFMILGYFVLNLFLFSPNLFKTFRNTVMIYNTGNQSNDTTESQKEKNAWFNVNFYSTVSQKSRD